MSDRPSRKRKVSEKATQYQEELVKQDERAKRRVINKDLKKQVDDLSDLMAKMDTKLTEPTSEMDVEGGRRRRRTHKRRGGKRKTHRKH